MPRVFKVYNVNNIYMNINYKEFNEYSKKTKQKLITFTELLLSEIEIHNENGIPFSDFEKVGFSHEDVISLINKLNVILDKIIINLKQEYFHVGTKGNLTKVLYFYMKYKPETISIINSFLKKVLKNNDSKNKEIKYNFPFRIPAGTTWESVYIKFKNNEDVQIKVAGHVHETSFADMGFVDNRTGKPNEQWQLLKLFAIKGGNLPPSSPDAEDKYKKHKQLLSDKLKTYFKIDLDPFKPYDKINGYTIKLNLAPEKKEKETQNSIEEEMKEIFQDFSDSEK